MDIVDVNVGICPFCPPLVKQIQKLLQHETASDLQRHDPAEEMRTCSNRARRN